MEQRRLRLGDILDDYCPRERRVTNHAIVAMIEEDVKQTRCTTCDAEHVYKGAKVPARRRKESAAAAPALSIAAATPAAHVDVDAELEDMPQDNLERFEDTPPAETAHANGNGHGTEEAAGLPDLEDGPVHRPLIRATLPRPEGQPKDSRPLPEFTVRQPGTRGAGHFRGDGRNKMRAQGNGHRPHGRFSGPRPGGSGRGGGGQQAGFRSGPPRHGGGKKRSR